MQLSFSTGTFYHRSLSYSAWLAREAGFDGLEVALGPEYTLRGVASMTRTLRAYGVPALSVHPPFKGLPGWPRGAVQVVPLLSSVTQQLGAGLAVVHTPFVSSEHGPRAQSYAAGLRLGLDAAGGSVELGLESSQYNRRNRRFLLDDLAALTQFALQRGCGVTFDTCHAGANGQDILACYEIVRPALRNVHFSDVRWRGGRSYTHVLPGGGVLPLDRFLALLSRDGYTGLVTLEVRPEEVGVFGRARHLHHLREALAYMRAALRAPAAPTPQPAAPDHQSLPR